MNKTINYYNHAYETLAQNYENANVSNIHSLLINTFNKKNKLLEIGCGSGRDASFMFNHGYDVIAIDGSKNMIQEAKRVHPNISNKLLQKVLPRELNFTNKFDGIYSIATLMHLSINDLKESLSKIYNLLENNGQFLMSVSLNRNDIDENGFDENGRYFLTLKENEWIELLKEIGFIVKNSIKNEDGLNRKSIQWLTIISKKQ
jgi:cyclopropane fatty-acyl-phospholipid synthase-like methyltransferase